MKMIGVAFRIAYDRLSPYVAVAADVYVAAYKERNVVSRRGILTVSSAVGGKTVCGIKAAAYGKRTFHVDYIVYVSENNAVPVEQIAEGVVRR